MKIEWNRELPVTYFGPPESCLEIGGGRSMPLAAMDGPLSKRPLIGLEMEDTVPPFSEPLLAQYGRVPSSIQDWYELLQNFSPDFISIYLSGASRDTGSRSIEEVLDDIEKLARIVKLPSVVWGSEDEEVDRVLLPAVAELFAGHRIAIGPATETCYREIVEAALKYEHLVIALSPLDLNLAKQLNLMLKDAGLPPARSIIFPTTGALGYGLEYAFSTMEKTRIEGLKGDIFLSQPMLAQVGREAWKAREVYFSSASTDPIPENNDFFFSPSEQMESKYEMAISWEITTAMAMLAAGAGLLVMKGPLAALAVKNFTISQLGRWS